MPQIAPTAFLLQAALLAAQVLSAKGNTARSVLSSYQTVVSGGLYRVEDLRRGESILVRARLLEVHNSRLIPSAELLSLRELPPDVGCELLLRTLLMAERPLWIYAAVADEDVLWENVPDGDQRLLTQLINEADRREKFLLTLGKTIDTDLLAELGAEGETHIVSECVQHLTNRGRPDLAAGVKQVSFHSDQLGYDITSPDTGGNRHRLEVKTMGSVVDRAEFFLSRNEARVGHNDPLWSIVIVGRDHEGSLRTLGWCRSNAVAGLLPTDTSRNGRWASVRISLPLEALQPGLPLDAA